ncbi:alpha beta-hydrolase [Coniophora puteana RWD-64-598 SS2]|uniref:Alpha beta-hydrolase n=1 Tax=Coniophora puteana (strain RWD-64-598) TaxID=741705 RepID=A0A5M3MLH3_CONPW|nr:alpha beta-hydrolase [Coniophora puteana RWD-64-598 SS2]EIW79525.1 alpha beta-hydrolase [Coniophora puteana RWD-64-598 SS2]
MATASSFVTKQVQSSDGLTIYAEAVGDSSKPAVVFVHGFMLSGAVWDNLFLDPTLLSSVYMVRYDVRGEGRSGKPTSSDGYASALFAADYQAVASAFGVKNPVLVGWSLGATAAADIIANINPNPLAGIFYVAPLPYINETLIEACASALLQSFLGPLTSDTDVTTSLSTRVAFGNALFINPDAIPWEERFEWNGMGLSMGPFECSSATSRPQDGGPLLAAGQAGLPTMIVAASNDQQVVTQSAINALQPYFTNLTTATIQNAGHAAHIDNQSAYVQLLTTFVKQVNKHRRGGHH